MTYGEGVYGSDSSTYSDLKGIPTHSTDAIILRHQSLAHSTDVAASLSHERSHATDAFIKSPLRHDVDALIKAKVVRSHGANASVYGTAVLSHSTTADIWQFTKTPAPPLPEVESGGVLRNMGSPLSAPATGTTEEADYSIIVHRKPERMSRTSASGGVFADALNPCFHRSAWADNGMTMGPGTYQYMHGPEIPVMESQDRPTLNGQPYERDLMWVQRGNTNGTWRAVRDSSAGQGWAFRWEAEDGSTPSSSSKELIFINGKLCNPGPNLPWLLTRYTFADEADLNSRLDGSGRALYPNTHIGEFFLLAKASDYSSAPQITMWVDSYTRQGVFIERREDTQPMSTFGSGYNGHGWTGGFETWELTDAVNDNFYYIVGVQFTRTMTGAPAYFMIEDTFFEMDFRS